jgi:hypothetical protein
MRPLNILHPDEVDSIEETMSAQEIIAVIQCEQNKYFICRRGLAEPRDLESIKKEYGKLEWLQKYPVIALRSKEEVDGKLNAGWELPYFKRYGLDNLRGGNFSKCDLSEAEVNVINAAIFPLTDAASCVDDTQEIESPLRLIPVPSPTVPATSLVELPPKIQLERESASSKRKLEIYVLKLERHNGTLGKLIEPLSVFLNILKLDRKQATGRNCTAPCGSTDDFRVSQRTMNATSPSSTCTSMGSTMFEVGHSPA